MTNRQSRQRTRKADRGVRRIVRGVSRIPGVRGLAAAAVMRELSEQVLKRVEEQGRVVSDEDRFVVTSLQAGLGQPVRGVEFLGHAAVIAADVADALSPLPQPFEVLADIPINAVRDLGQSVVNLRSAIDKITEV